MKRILGVLLVLVCVLHASAFDAKSVALQYIKKQKAELNLADQDIKDLQLVDQYYDKTTGLTRIWFNQTANGLPLKNAMIGVHINSKGEVANVASSAVINLREKANLISPKIDAAATISRLAEYMGVSDPGPVTFSEKQGTQLLFSPVSNLTNLPVVAELKYVVDNKDGDKIKLSWEILMHSLNNQHFWLISMDAGTGELINKQDQIIHCSIKPGSYSRNFIEQDNTGTGSVDIVTPSGETNTTQAPPNASYRVYPYSVESPVFGSRVLVSNPHSASTASPYGWHDTDGNDTPNFTITRGNNVHAYEDKDGNDNVDPNSSPDGTSSLTFDYTLNFSTQLDTLTNAKAGVTQLFYMNNIMHDIYARYGFTEEAGNFQEKNYTNVAGGKDYVWAEAHDGESMNNANFYASPDGINTSFNRSRMQMFMWDDFSPTNLVVNSPGSIAGPITCGRAAFGPCSYSVTGALVNAVASASSPPSYVCSSVTNSSEVNGKIAIIDRGTCNFSEKVYNAQNAGAIGVIIVNRQSAGDSLLTMAAGTFAAQVTIPAVFVTYADGQKLRNNIATANVTISRTSSNNCLEPDGSLDNGIVAHEYGHGISIRLTGGRTTNTCLLNAEQAGEGWSDFIAMVLTHKSGDTKNTARGMANYVYGETPAGRGLRRFPFSYDMSINPLTYAWTDTSDEVHDIGEIWTAALWDMYWLMIEKDGYSSDLYNGNAGNNKAISIVIEGMKQQPCSPGFIDSRNAILKADSILYGFAHKCEIWKAFARRGMGFSARQGSNNLVGDETPAYDLPSSCNLTPTASFTWSDTSVCRGGSLTFTNTSTGSPDSVRWTINGGTPSTSSSTTTVTPTFNTAGNFSVSLSIYKGGTTYGPFTKTIRVKSIPVVNIVNTDTSICAGASVVITATGASSYLWNDGILTFNRTVTPASTTKYTVTGTTEGCIAKDSLTVTVKPLPTVSAGPNTTICTGNSTTLTASGATSYQWTGGPATAGYTVTPTATTTYTVTGTTNGCSATSTVTVTVTNTPPNVTIATTPSNAICFGQSVTLTASGAGSYQWTGGPATPGYTVSPTTSTNYLVTGAVTGCPALTDTTTIQIIVKPLPATVAGSGQTICAGQSATLTASGATTYQWTGGPANASYTVSPSSTTTYTVSGTTNGCSASDNVTVTVNPAPSPGTITQRNDTIFTSGTGTSYNWYRGGLFVSTTNDPYLKISQSGSYQVEVVGANACISAKSSSFSATLTAIRTNTLNIQYQVIPNPNNGEFEVRIVSNKTAQYDLVLYDVAGKEIMREELQIANGVNNKRYNFSRLSAGVYFLSLIGAEGISTQNVVIE